MTDRRQLLAEKHTAGILSGLSVTNSYDAFLRRTRLYANTATAFTNLYGYDTASRLIGVTNGAFSAGYTYLANSPLLNQVTFKQSGTTRMTTTRQWDFLNRLGSIGSVPAATNQLPLSYGYLCNDANQRVRVNLADGSFWLYSYDALGQVTSGKRYWNDGTPVPGQQYEYGFDDIGNRTIAKAGGDAVGGNLRSAGYTNNVANQLTSRGVPGAVDVLGIATASAAVTVNSSAADYRRGEYFQELVSVGNTSAPQWTNVTVTASQGGTNSPPQSGYVYVPRAPEAFQYDADGNLTNDGRWGYTWDAENRLVRMEPSGSFAAPTGSLRKLEFWYDHQGRRIRKKVTNLETSLVTDDRKFLYDAWNLLAELNATNNAVIRSYVWGLDLSGSEQGAGGVGGLLFELPAGGNALCAAYDGNGNVMGLVDATAGTVVGQNEYGPFGEPIRVSGSAAGGNPFRFSTKYQDAETDLLYYGFRYYSPSTGRWLSRDPVEERGGIALYCFCANEPVGRHDVDGRFMAGPESRFWAGDPFFTEISFERNGWGFYGPAAGGRWSQPYGYGEGRYSLGEHSMTSWVHLWSGPADAGICNSIAGCLPMPPSLDGRPTPYHDETVYSSDAGSFNVVARSRCSGKFRLYFEVSLHVRARGPDGNASSQVWQYGGAKTGLWVRGDGIEKHLGFATAIDVSLSRERRIVVHYRPWIEFLTTPKTPCRESEGEAEGTVTFLGSDRL